MKRVLSVLICSSLLLASCDTYTGSGAYAGASLGSILGSAIGGLGGGPRGSDLGTVIGMAGGAAVGAAIGAQADANQQQRMSRRHERMGEINSRSSVSQYDSMNDTGVPDSGFDANNGGDDRLYDFSSSDYTGDYSAQQPTSVFPSAKVDELGTKYAYSPSLEIVNARFVDDNQDNTLNRNETCKVIFEVVNRGKQPVFDVVPTVVETTGNKHIFISPNIHVERIDPGKGIRYTAMVKADSRLKDGMARFCVSVIHGDKAISKVNEFNIPTSGKRR